ncbi:MAG: rod shape-determining protein [Patescibacteria group bacterium]|nr:rod shape-determining protein [Patescibacteria group bacterium]
MFNFTNFFSKIKIPFFTNFEVYFDFGTTETKIAIKDKGIILRETTIIAKNNRTNEYIFFGKEASEIIGKNPEFIKIIKPINHGVIVDFDSQVSLIKRYLEQSVYIYFNNQIIKPALTGISVIPYIATEIEQKALKEALYKNGINKVFLIEKALATASGCGINIFSHKPSLIVDIGGGLIEIAIVGSGGIIAQKTLKNAGESMNKTIFNYIYLKYGVILGELTCEQLKKNLLNFNNEEKIITVKGKSLESGLPKSIKVKSSEIKEALINNFNQIIDNIKELLEISPPEIIDEINNQGIYLTGGMSKISGLGDFFKNQLKIDIIQEDINQYATIRGIISLSKNKDKLAKIII